MRVRSSVARVSVALRRPAGAPRWRSSRSGWGGRGVQAQATDRVLSTEGTVTGKVVAVSTEGRRGRGSRRRDPEDPDRPDSRGAVWRRAAVAAGGAVDAGPRPGGRRRSRNWRRSRPPSSTGPSRCVLDEIDFVKAAAAGRAALCGRSRSQGRRPSSWPSFSPSTRRATTSTTCRNSSATCSPGPARPTRRSAAYASLRRGRPRSRCGRRRRRQACSSISRSTPRRWRNTKRRSQHRRQRRRQRRAEAGRRARQGPVPRPARQECRRRSTLVQAVIKQADPEEKDLLGRAYNVLGAAYRARRRQGSGRPDLVPHGRPGLQRQSRQPRRGALQPRRAVGEGEAIRSGRERPASCCRTSYPASPWAKKLAAAGGA